MNFLNTSSSQDVVLSQRASRQADQMAAVKGLENTIARFQAILTDDDRKNLQQLKTEPHDAQSIIMFTASLDRFDPKRRGKSVASRLASFLQTIEQFTPIVDTYIQPNPEIAALVWGSVKLTFQLLANLTSYFQSFVELLSGFGSLYCAGDTPANEITSMDGYYLIFPNEEHQLQAKARQKAEESHGRISSLLTKDRSEMRLIGEHGTRGTAEQRRRRLLKDLSSHNYTSAFNNARNKRHLGTAEWAFNTDQFQNWLTGDGPVVLHVTGKIGSGKTILASSIVEHLCQIRQPNQFISFFFSRFDNPTTLVSDTIIRSLVQQLLSMAPMETMNATLASKIADCLQNAQDNFFSLDTLGKLYETASKFTQDWFILIDGVDECESEQQRLLYDFLSRFLNNCSGPQRIRILFSSRETTKQEIERSFGSLARGELVVRDEDIIGDILDAIASKEEGMFLWAFLAIEDICSGTNDREIRESIQEIPTDLPTTFDRALNRIAKRRNQKIASEIFGWTTAARQPLTLTQLQEALSVKVGQHNLHPDGLISGMDRITVWCENLVCVEETDNTVHFSHHSIREYLLKPESGDLKDFHVNLEEFDHHVGEVCITYLHLENLKTALIEGEKAEPPPTVTVTMEGLSEQTVRTAVGGSMGARVGRWTSRVVKSTSRSAQPSAGGVAIHSTLGSLRYAPPASKGIELLDFCKLIPTGYVAQDDMCIRDFALVALSAVTKPQWFRLPGLQNESSSLLTARTSNKMSIVDIAAEQNDEESLGFLRSFFKPRCFQQGELFEAAKDHGEMEKLALGGFCTALRNGSSESAKFLFEQCVDLFSSEQADQFEQLDIINLHLALSQAAVFEWPFDTTKNILFWFFSALVVKRNMEAAMNHLIEESIKADNWKFAAAVVDTVSDLEFERTESDDPFFKMTLDSLNCQRCRGRQSWPEPMDTPLLFADQRYKLCSKHKRHT
ncbi:NACHT domain-containing protein [Fusarium falciforme]|uniref:NACHT domain-containing protein n=1 Tax=Fusarium falciforme TaxID=195108 RepID=UPI002300AEA1|nr:NACHT domain-containing protein [Fusarium falciforme]WAO86305.1 NACHT domain-containing protein [Fusarium falciforme]